MQIYGIAVPQANFCDTKSEKYFLKPSKIVLYGCKGRLREYIKTLNISEREFCRQIGVSSSYVNNIRQSIRPDKMKAIGEKFPELNPMWLLTGDGTMRNGDNTNRISGNNNTAVAGNGNQVTTNDIAGLIELQKGYQEMIKEKDSQIARLISVIEKLSEK
jgi:transcriptional regulator with XRE-family HTH domain